MNTTAQRGRRRRIAIGAGLLGGLLLIGSGTVVVTQLRPDGPAQTRAAEPVPGVPPVKGRPVADTPPGPGSTLPHQAKLPAGKTIPATKRLGEKLSARTANAKVFTLADGRTQAEVSGTPLHYRDAAGKWQDIDTTIRGTTKRGYAYAAEKNTFSSLFGNRTDKLARYELGGGSIAVGADGPARDVTPKVRGAAITYPDVFGSADVAYDVTSSLMKEKIVLDRAPDGAASYTFTLALDGVRATAQPDGSVEFRSTGSDGPPLFYLPKPFMYDSAGNAGTATGTGWSNKVTQVLTGTGSRLRLTMTADQAWLRDPARKYPVVIDPTIKVQPQVGQAQDGMVNSYEPATNYDSNWRLSVGTNKITDTTNATFRSLVKFPLTEVPPGTKLDSAQLKLYFDQTMVNELDDTEVPINAHRATTAWAENSVTWNSVLNSVGEIGTNTEQIDNVDPGKTAAAGAWPLGTATTALGGTYVSNSGATTGDNFTWVPRVTEAGTYEVKVHYVPGSDRATNAPYTIHHKGGSTVKTVNQTTGSGNGAWVSLGSYAFDAGTTHKVVLGDVAGKVVVADGVRLIKNAADLKGKKQNHAWHTFSVRSIVQDWLDGKQANNGFIVKTDDESKIRSGPRYEGAENAFAGEVDTFPTMVLTWGKPGVTLQMPTTIRSTGAELAWSAYADPSPNTTTGDDILEYQVHRSTAQSFIPSERTLVAPVIKDRTAYSDTSGTPTPANNATEFGAPFYYMIVVKTRDGQLIPSPTEQVQLPKAGHIVRVLQGNSTDTTLTSKDPAAGHDVLDGGGLVQVGIDGTKYGTSRAVMKWPSMTGLPAGTKVLSAKVGLWGAYSEGGTGATFNMHALTQDFDEATGSWNRASTATAWTTAGGDFTGTVAGAVSNIGTDPRWQNWTATSLVQGWVNTPSSNHGVLFKVADETSATRKSQRVLFTGGEVPDIRQRPRLEVIYTAPATENTYYAPTVPSRMIPGDEYTSPVTITNSTSSTWAKNDWVLSYRWELADGTDVTNADNQRETALPVDLASGAVTTVQAKIMTPVRSDQGNKRQKFVLKWDLRNKTTNQWLSQVWEIPPLAQPITVEDPTSDQLGLEKFYQYTGQNAGAGSTVMVNQFSGNAVFSYNAFSNPSRGLSTFLRLSYNSQDSSNSYIGYGWSLSTSTVTRLGSPLQFSGGDARWPAKITLTDGDGTSHWFDLNKHNSGNEADWDYDNPAGVHLYLQRNGDDPTRTWVMTRPDRSQFYFDADGYQTAVVDKNGNDLRFTYERVKVGNRNTGVLKYITDATGRRTLTFEYFNSGDNFQYFTGSSDTKLSGTNLANAQIVNQLRAITDVSGRRITLTYNDKGMLREVLDGQGTADEKPFGFYYDDAAGQNNPKLVRVDDPRGNGTKVGYFPASAGNLLKWRAAKVTDRNDKDTDFTYTDPDGSTGSFIENVVTDANGHPSTYLIDGFGRPTLLTNAKQQQTELTWDADNNVRRLEEANGAVATWVYDEKTGLPTEIKDPEANKNNWPAQKMEYRFGLKGHTAELISKTSPEGRKHTFGYDDYGNLTSVTDPKGNATATEGDYTSVYKYDTWGQQTQSTDANDNTTYYKEYDPVGYPTVIEDALNQKETYDYDEIGNVVSITDANDKTSTYTYDIFGRPLNAREPKDAANGVYIVTPGPTYDGNDNIVRQEAANGAVSEAGHDPSDRVMYFTDPKDSASSPDRMTTYEYDNVGNPLSETEPKGNLTAAVDDYTSHYRYDELNQLVEGTDPAGGKVVSTYDNVGNLKTVADQRKTATPSPDDYSEKYDYDLNSRPTVTTDALGHTTKSEYDRDGNETAQVDQDGNRTLIAYDERSAVREQQVPYNKSGSTINYRTTRYEYDEVGNQTRVISPRGVATDDPDDFTAVTVYDALNRVKEKREPYDKNDSRAEYRTADTTIYTYDKLGNTETVSSPPSHGESARTVTRYTYWDNSWNKTSTDPFNIKTEYDYDVMGNQTSRKVTGSGKTRQMNWTYFPDNKQKTQSDDGEGGSGARKNFSFAYDPNANLTEMQDKSTDAKIDVYAMTYDVVNRLKKVEEKLNGTVKNTTGYDYDLNDNLLERTHDKTYSKFEYDERDLVKTVTNGKSSTDTGKKTTTFSYTKQGQVKTEEKGNKNTVTYDYYLNQQLQHQVEKKQSSGAVVNEHTIEYDANGHRSKDVAKKQNADNKSGTLDSTTTYTYDPRDRIREQVKTGNGANTEKYIHDANSNVIDQTVKGTRTTFNYDKNRLTESVTHGPTNVTSTYKYDHFGRQESTTTAGTETEKYTYDGFDRVKTHKKTPGGTTEYTYDPLDRQQTRKQNSKTTELSYVGMTDQVLAEEEDGKLRKTYQYGPDGKLLAQAKYKDDGSFEDSYQGYNPHTDVEQITDEQGDSRATYGYTAYGNNDDSDFTGADKPDPANPEDPNKEPYNSYRYNGKRFDQSTGNYDMGFRDYDPGLNRFLSQDNYNGALDDMNLTTDPFTNNRYAFGGGNPITQVELDGHLSLGDIGHAALDVAGLVPGVGEVADLANAAWYAAEGDYANAALSAASAIPFAGYAASAVKAGKYAAKGVDAAQSAAKGADAARSGSKAANAAQGGGKTATAPAKASSGGGGPTAGKAAGGGGSAGPAKAGGGGGPGKAGGGGGRSGGGTGASKPGSCKNSFLPGTAVLMADGSAKAIEDVEIGDEVLASDPELGITEARPVTELITGDGEKHLVKITVDTDGDAGDQTGTVIATDKHPFWVDNLGRFVDAAELRVSDDLRTADGDLLDVVAIREWTEHRQVHNLSIDGIHTYYVVAGDSPVLVHNATCKTVKENDAGAYGKLSPGQKGDGLEANHMPQDALRFLSKSEGGAIVMKAADHALTRTYKNKGKATKAAEAGLPFRTVLARDIWDLRRIGQQQYGDPGHFNKGIQGLMSYYRGKGMV